MIEGCAGCPEHAYHGTPEEEAVGYTGTNVRSMGDRTLAVSYYNRRWLRAYRRGDHQGMREEGGE
jgi:hypothetical protein